MSERMTDDRILGYERIWNTLGSREKELLQALKAEREWARACTRSGSEQCALRDTRIAELEATIKLQQGAIAAKDKFNRQQQSTIARVRGECARLRARTPRYSAKFAHGMGWVLDYIDKALGENKDER